MGIHSTSFWRLLLRSFTPSLVELLIALCAAITLVGGHLVLLSTSSGVLLPSLFNEQSDYWVQTYDSFVLRPLEGAQNNPAFDVVATAFFWSIVGVVILGTLAGLVQFARNFRNEERSVGVGTTANEYIMHPGRRSFLHQLIWRATVGVATLIATIFVLRLVKDISIRDELLLHSSSWVQFVRGAGANILVWVGIIHLYVIALRLFLFRTRVTGEVIE